MKKMKLLLLFVFVSATNIMYSQGQDTLINSPQLNKNATYFTVGGMLSLSGSFNYERVMKRKKATAGYWFLKGGVGALAPFWDDGFGAYIQGQVGIITGRKKHHLEMGTGIAPIIGDNPYGRGIPPLTGTIGWRIQKPGSKFIFRTGISYPDGIYFSFGFGF